METNSWTATRTDGVYRVTRTTTYPPTQAALAEAARVETQAAEVVKASRAALSAALAVLKDTFEGDMMLAEVEFSSGRADAAFAALASALKRQPRSLEANQMVAERYRRLGRADDADRQMSLTVNLVQASAGWMLRTAWRKIADKDVAGARAALDAAKTLDPEDARLRVRGVDRREPGPGRRGARGGSDGAGAQSGEARDAYRARPTPASGRSGARRRTSSRWPSRAAFASGAEGSAPVVHARAATTRRGAVGGTGRAIPDLQAGRRRPSGTAPPIRHGRGGADGGDARPRLPLVVEEGLNSRRGYRAGAACGAMRRPKT